MNIKYLMILGNGVILTGGLWWGWQSALECYLLFMVTKDLGQETSTKTMQRILHQV